MTSRSRNALIGLFVIGGLVCLAILIIKFGEGRGLFSNRYIVKAKFESIIGVREGTDVNLAGVWVGTVQKVKLMDTKIPVSGAVAWLEIDESYTVPKDSVAYVYTPILGQPIINIHPPRIPTETLPRDGSGSIRGEVKNPLETAVDPELLNTLSTTTKEIRALAHSLNSLTQKRYMTEGEKVDVEKLSPNLYAAVIRLHNILEHFDKFLGDPEVQSDIRQTVENFRQTSEQAKTAVAELENFGKKASQTVQHAREALDTVTERVNITMDNTNQHVDKVARQVATNLDKVSQLLDYLNSAGQDLAEGEGTMGMLLRDSRFYDSLLLTVQRIGQAANELKVLVIQWQRKGLISSVQQ